MKRIFLTILFCATALTTRGGAPSKDIYLDLMQKAVEAYTPEHIRQYADRVSSEGVTEHGFARLTSNMGILVSKGRIPEMKETFVELMDICAREIPVAREKNRGKGEIGNDFAVKELVCCILEAEASGLFPPEKLRSWREAFVGMKAADIYSVQPVPGDGTARNWCVFGAASECARLMAGIGGEREYADRYLGDQLRFFDENGMYRDPGSPMVYDLVTRLQYMAALDFGYDGPVRQDIEALLMRSAPYTLMMQSVTGEIPYGGRSNQFLHNEAFLAAVCEWYATRMKSMGEMKTAGQFKAAAHRAAASLDYWISQDGLRHIKNRYPIDSGYGCERYAYFDKYMVTMASWAYLAYRFADDSIAPDRRRPGASTFVTGPDFHRILMNAGGYTVEFDINPEKKYDAAGIGRIQKAGTSPVAALASPCPAAPKPSYALDIANPEGGLAVAPLWDKYEIVQARKGRVTLTDGKSVWKCRLSRRGLSMVLTGDGPLVLTLPALVFDGETHSAVDCTGKSLEIRFKGDRCRYSTDGAIVDTGLEYGSRNGHLHRYEARGTDKLKVRVQIR